MLLLAVPALANDNDEAKIKTAVEDRYKEMLAAINKKDAVALTELYDENAVLMPQMEEPLLGKAAIGEYYKKLVVNPLFSPFMLRPNWSSFNSAGDFAIVTWHLLVSSQSLLTTLPTTGLRSSSSLCFPRRPLV